MRPIDFVVHRGDNDSNPFSKDLAKALMVPIRINDFDGEYEITSYHMYDGEMNLHIQRKDDS